MAGARVAIDKIVPLHYEINLLGESKVAFEFLEFREVAVFVSPAIEQFHDYLVSNFDRLHPGDIESAPDLTGEELRENLEWRRYHKATAHINQSIREFQSEAQRKISPDSVPETSVKLDPWPTPEKDPDLFYETASRRGSPYRRLSPFEWNAGDTASPQPEP